MTEPTAHPGSPHHQQSSAATDDRDWTALAACRDMDTEFFYSGKPGSQQPKPRAVCAGCPVIRECFEWAMAVEEEVGDDTRHGVWGGQTPSGRAQIQRNRTAAQAEGCRPATYDAAQLRVMARNARGANSIYTGGAVPRRDHSAPTVGSRWTSIDKRNANRSVVVLEVTDEFVYLQREQPPGPNGERQPGRRSRMQTSQFTYRYYRDQSETDAP